MSTHNMFSLRNKKNIIWILPLICSYDLLTHCRLNEKLHTIYWEILNLILGIPGYVNLTF